jgi:DNA-binding transcriptional LysR family regulator
MKTALTTTNVRVFEAVVRLQSVTRAAEELETSQPYISKQIAMMEEQLSAQLFSRVGRRLYLTRAGEMLHSAHKSGGGVFEKRRGHAVEGCIRFA